jgi:hypothetical protein
VPAVLVDDHLLFATLRGQEPTDLRTADTTLWTTGLWHHRLCRGLVDRGVRGTFSRRLGDESEAVAAQAVASAVQLPPDIGSIALRHLAWPMAQIVGAGHRLNLLALEALAAAEALDATICLAPANQAPTLVAAADARGVEVRVVGPA